MPRTRCTARWRWIAGFIALVSVIGPIGVGGAQTPAGVSPTDVARTLARGETAVVEKTVVTPAVAPKGDVYFLADTTSSMSSPIAGVRTNATAILDAVRARFADVRFGAGDYRDFPSDAYAFRNAAPVSDDGGAGALAAIAAWQASGGGDTPEAQLYALYRLATAPEIGYRGDATRLVVWFGDVPGHDPICAGYGGLLTPISEADVTAALKLARIKVIAVSVGDGAMDRDPGSSGQYSCPSAGRPGQATRIAEATGGVHLSASRSADLGPTIIGALGSTTLTVSPTIDEDAGLEVTVDPPERSVGAGETATFTERIRVREDAPAGRLRATVDWRIGGASAGTAFIEQISVQVEGQRAPLAEAGGPYELAQGTSVKLDGGASTHPDGDPLSFDWDLDDDACVFSNTAYPTTGTETRTETETETETETGTGAGIETGTGTGSETGRGARTETGGGTGSPPATSAASSAGTCRQTPPRPRSTRRRRPPRTRRSRSSLRRATLTTARI